MLWQRIYESSTIGFWNGFTRLFSELDDDRVQSLMQIGFPDDAISMQEVLDLIGEIKLPVKTVLVIDDYHIIDSPKVDSFIEFLVENEIDNLNIVLTVRFTKFQRIQELMLKGYLLHINKEILELTAKEISEYYRVCGIALKDKEADKLYSFTEGWISALYMLMLEYVEQGKYTPVENIYKLIEKAVYVPLSDEIKEVVIILCIFDSFTHEQAVNMWVKKIQVSF